MAPSTSVLSAEDRARYEPAINSILAATDLDTVTRIGEHVRKVLEQQFGIDLTSQKSAIGSLIGELLAAYEISDDDVSIRQLKQRVPGPKES